MVKTYHYIDAGLFKLDGGAMFGVVPKSIWSKLNPPDDNNMCTWSLRCLLLETENRLILVDTGIGQKQDDKFRSFYSPHGEKTLKDSLSEKGFGPDDITDVFLTHLHFDHCGGAVDKNSNGALVPAFHKAKYWSNQLHWEWATNPNDRERASFLQENFVPLMEHRVLHFIDHTKPITAWMPGIAVRFCYGHTEAMMALEFDCDNQHYVYCADLIPSSYHISPPFIMAYDVRPLLSLQEKMAVLERAAKYQHRLIFEHDPHTESCGVKYDERGRIVKLPT